MKAGVGVASTLAAALALAGCEEAANVYVEPPPAEVTVARPLVRTVTEYLDFTGTTEASEAVQVRARVAGVLEDMHFTPGTVVEAGDLLFTIDPKEYEADLLAVKAERASAEATLTRAETELARAERLFKQKAASDAEVVRWRGEKAVAEAAVQRAEASIARAELDLGYTRITAPISGRVGRNLVDVGNLVGEGEATVLTDIVRYDPMFAYFNLNERDLLRVLEYYRQEVEARGVDPNKEPDSRADIELELALANEEGFAHGGLYDFGESGVDPRTGTMRLRGRFPNGDNPPRLLPGLFARIRMPIAERENALLVSERALGSDQSGRYLLVVNGENVVEKRFVTVDDDRLDGMLRIESGLEREDRVVVRGIQRARPGAEVAPEEVEMSTLATSARDITREAAGAGESTGDAGSG